MPEPPLIAIVDDDKSIREATSNLLQSMGWSTVMFPDATSFLQSPGRRGASCVVADVRMPGLTGFEMYDQLVAAGEGIPTVLITAYPNDFVRARARDAGVVCCLGKPFAPDELLRCVRTALAQSQSGQTP